jgi:hypothetical protein
VLSTRSLTATPSPPDPHDTGDRRKNLWCPARETR